MDTTEYLIKAINQEPDPIKRNRLNQLKNPSLLSYLAVILRKR